MADIKSTFSGILRLGRDPPTRVKLCRMNLSTIASLTRQLNSTYVLRSVDKVIHLLVMSITADQAIVTQQLPLLLPNNLLDCVITRCKRVPTH